MTNFLLRRFVKNAQDVKNPLVREGYGKFAGIVGIICNVFLCTGKILSGLLFSSLSILADGINNLSDATSSIVTLICFKMSGRPADSKHPYGHARMEYVSGLVVAFIILILGFDLVKSSFDKIIHPQPTIFSWLSAAILIVSILVKLWMFLFYRKLAKKIDSSALYASATDSRNDVLTTAAVLLALFISYWTDWQLDGWMGLALAVFIIYSGIRMIVETMSPLLGEAPNAALVQEMMEKIRGYEGVLGIHDLMVHDYGPGRCFASVHVEMDAREEVLKSHDVIDCIERDFLAEGIHLVIHYDPIVTDDDSVNELRTMVARVIASLGEQITFHDFRVVKGYTHTNLIFDVVVPAGYAKSERELKDEIQRRVWQVDRNCLTVVSLDYNYIG